MSAEGKKSANSREQKDNSEEDDLGVLDEEDEGEEEVEDAKVEIRKQPQERQWKGNK